MPQRATGHPESFPSVLHRLVETVSASDRIVTITEVEGKPMTWAQACSYVQRFNKFRQALRAAVNRGEAQWETKLAQAYSIAASREQIPGEAYAHIDGVYKAVPRGAVSFWNKEKTTFAKTMEAALEAQKEFD